jgi:hypothetical protein
MTIKLSNYDVTLDPPSDDKPVQIGNNGKDPISIYQKYSRPKVSDIHHMLLARLQPDCVAVLVPESGAWRLDRIEQQPISD